MTDIKRFMAKVIQRDNGCWEWTGAKSGDGYGEFKVDGKVVATHRWLYKRTVGPIPKGRDLDHLCRNLPCVNPDHLEPVSHRENVLRGKGLPAQNVAKTHCPQGHPYDLLNTHWYRGERRCRACDRERQRRATREELRSHGE